MKDRIIIVDWWITIKHTDTVRKNMFFIFSIEDINMNPEIEYYRLY